MSKIKAIIDFTDYPASELATLAGAIHERLVLHADRFPDPPVSTETLGMLVADYRQKLAARASRASADVLALRQARHALEQALRTLGYYVNTVAGGRAEVVEMSGFPSFSTVRTRDLSPPAAPTDLRLRHLTLSGSILARYRPTRRHGGNEVQVTTGDPNDESSWRRHGIFPGGRAEMTGLPPGALIWVRVRTIGLRGVMGAWSDPAQIRVI
ncbi:MAG: hypothetical protein JNK37_04695 [Verrucomicrobiales bacterium]|nr:hypothetical protein [Verrucomicrobiales bacterium]